jgi:hypothetical protein
MGVFNCVSFVQYVLKAKNWSQYYHRELQRLGCYNAVGSLARFENKNILFYFVKRCSLL